MNTNWVLFVCTNSKAMTTSIELLCISGHKLYCAGHPKCRRINYLILINFRSDDDIIGQQYNGLDGHVTLLGVNY